MSEQKTQVTLVGQDGNVFNLVGLASKALKRNGKHDEAKEMSDKVFSCGSYDEALSIIMDYCDVD